MELNKIELERIAQDSKLAGFYDFVDVDSICGLRLVHRDSKQRLGLIDDNDRIIVPLIYDEIGLGIHGIETKMIIDGETYCGWIHPKTFETILPASFNHIFFVEGANRFWCSEGKQWFLINCKKLQKEMLSVNLLPLFSNDFVCVLHLNKDFSCSIECWDENGNNSLVLLRQLALSSEQSNRIKLSNKYYNLIAYSDIYGNVIHMNRNAKDLFK